jgi:hypothetical protein
VTLQQKALWKKLLPRWDDFPDIFDPNYKEIPPLDPDDGLPLPVEQVGNL